MPKKKKKVIKHTCKCGAKFDVPDPGQATCPKCGSVVTATRHRITWSK
jgi:rRNA maturation endonuclease Nob1